MRRMGTFWAPMTASGKEMKDSCIVSVHDTTRISSLSNLVGGIGAKVLLSSETRAVHIKATCMQHSANTSKAHPRARGPTRLRPGHGASDKLPELAKALTALAKVTPVGSGPGYSSQCVEAQRCG